MPNHKDRPPTHSDLGWLDAPAVHRHLPRPEPDRPDDRWQRLLALAGHLVRHRQTSAQAAVRRYQQEMVDRASAATTDRVRNGWWLGPAPYGYRLARGPGGRRRLALDDHRSTTVGQVFAWYVLDQQPLARITRQLATYPDQHPRPIDHRTGQPRPWTARIVRRLLDNPAYLGYGVRRRTSDGQPLPPQTWQWSAQPAHPPLVDAGLFWTAYHRLHPEHSPDMTPAHRATPWSDTAGVGHARRGA